jgi:hypothetical protein
MEFYEQLKIKFKSKAIYGAKELFSKFNYLKQLKIA